MGVKISVGLGPIVRMWKEYHQTTDPRRKDQIKRDIEEYEKLLRTADRVVF